MLPQMKNIIMPSRSCFNRIFQTYIKNKEKQEVIHHLNEHGRYFILLNSDFSKILKAK